MKYFLADFILSVLFIIVLSLCVFGFINIILTAVLLFLLLALTFVYKFYVFAKPENMSKEFIEKEERKKERMKRRLLIDRAISIIDSTTMNLKKLHSIIRNFFYTLE